MSIIAIEGVPIKSELIHVIGQLKRMIKDNFQVLYYKTIKHPHNTRKVWYVQLKDAEAVKPTMMLMNNFRPRIWKKLRVFIPKELPPMAGLTTDAGLSNMFEQNRKTFGDTGRPHNVFGIVLLEIMIEMQSKFAKLYNLSEKDGHKLLEAIAKVIFDRLKTIKATEPSALRNCVQLSRTYRQNFPHADDINLILMILYKIDEAANRPHTQLTEEELMDVGPDPYVINGIPFKVLMAGRKNCLITVTDKVKKYLVSDKFNSEITDEEDPELAAARKEIRCQLLKMIPSFAEVAKNVAADSLIPELPVHRMKMYAEPKLSSTTKILHHYKAKNRFKSKRYYNLIVFDVHTPYYRPFVMGDGLVGDNWRLVVRSRDIPTFKLPESITSQIKKLFGVSSIDFEETPHVTHFGEGAV